MSEYFKLILGTLAMIVLVMVTYVIGEMASRTGPTARSMVPVFGLIIVLFVGLLVAYSIGTMFRARRQSADLLGALEQTVRLNLPLPQMLDAFSRDMRGSVGRRMASARAAMLRGESVALVLEMLPGFPKRLIPLIAVSERAGRLPQALSRIMRQQRDTSMRRARRPALIGFYPLLISTITMVVLGMLMIFVVPRFEMIFRDFGVELPTSTKLMLSLYRDWGGLAMLAVVIWFFASIALFFGQRRGVGIGLSASTAELIMDYLPFVGRVRFYRALSDALDFAAEGIADGRPAVESIDEAAAITTNARLRAKLEKWTSAMRFGSPINHAAGSAKLPKMMRAFLLSTGGNDLAASMKFLAGYYQIRFARAMAFITAAIPPLVAFTLGAIVGGVAISVFQAMVVLADKTLPYPVSL
jgi:type IV pilus assembly protein PilC